MSNEQCVQDLVTCKRDIDSYPFDLASPSLRTLQLAMPASVDLIADFNSAHAAEKEKLTNSLRDRSSARMPLSMHNIC